MCILDNLLVQPPLQKRLRVETAEPQDIDVTTCEQPPNKNHPRYELLSQRHGTRDEGMEAWVVEPHLSQVPPPRRGWQSSGQIAYQESISDATIADPAYANVGEDQPYIPNIHQQPRRQPYQGSQQRAT